MLRPLLVSVTFGLAAMVAAPSATAQGNANPGNANPGNAKAGQPRRDPKGIKGISPYWEALNKGDSAFVARDYDAAIAAYRAAITQNPQNPLGHYRMGEAHLAKGEFAEADAAWSAALRYAGSDHKLKGKILFVLADLRERQKQLDEAAERWTTYETFAAKEKQAKAYPATAADRKQRIATWKKLGTDYGEVKQRIEQRLKEADEKARKDATKGAR